MKIELTKKEQKVIIDAYNDACYHLARAKRKRDDLKERRIQICYEQAIILQGLVKKIRPKGMVFFGDLTRKK